MLEPYYRHEGCTIYHGDCADIIPQLPMVDLLLTDPPYGIGEAQNKRGGIQGGKACAPSKDYGAADWDDQPASDALLALAIARAEKSIIFGGNYFDLPPSSCWLVWDKDNGKNTYADCELAWTNLSKAVRLKRWRWHGMLQENSGSKKEVRQHPTQKPLAVMAWALEMVPDAAVVLDPFMGSGTTLRAAKDSGRDAIGIDLDERYCEIAADRLAQEVLF